MNCNSATLRRSEPLDAVRREFERNLGLSSDPFAQLSVVEAQDGVTVSIDLPGLSRDDISVTIDSGELAIAGDRKSRMPEDAKAIFSNQVFGEFRRTLKLHESIDPASVDAVLENGVLTLKLSKRPELQPRKIDIRAAS